MQLSELFQQLSEGELSQLHMGGRDEVGIRACDYDKIIPHINLGLTELYKRFNLKTSEVVVQQYDHIQLYQLSTKFAQTNKPADHYDGEHEPDKGKDVLNPLVVDEYYIMDSIYQPFTGNVLRIEKVHNELGEELYMNQDRAYFYGSDKYWAINTPSFDTIQVPYPEKENQMIITYRADHDPIVITETSNLNDIYVPISPSYLEPLLLYIAARVYTNMTTNEGNEGNNYTAKFEASIKQIEQLNLKTNVDTQNIKLDENGWV